MLVIVIAACSINKKTFFTVPRNGKIVKREKAREKKKFPPYLMFLFFLKAQIWDYRSAQNKKKLIVN